MGERLLSVGLDVGTTSTQMVVSELEIENQAGSFSVPKMRITGRKIRYRSPVHFTPLLTGELVDGDGLRRIVEEEYRRAGITKADVDTGAVIITGETSRKENARAVLESLAEYAGDFVVATAGPDLESRLAAQGAGAVEFSRKTGKTVLHMDIGGGTSNLAKIENGKITGTGCLNVGGRLVKISEAGKLLYVSPVLVGLLHKRVGEQVTRQEIMALAGILVRALEAAAGLREDEGLLRKLLTAEAGRMEAPKGAVISFSGGVADCIESGKEWLEFGDMGPELGQAIRESRLCRGEYMLGRETIRATVIGAGCHSTQLSGSTVYCQNVAFPLKNLPVVRFDESETSLQRRLRELDTDGVIAVKGIPGAGYGALSDLAGKIASLGAEPVYLALEEDMAKALGQMLALRMGKNARILCVDRVALTDGMYLDVGAPVGPALPVVVKTLVLGRQDEGGHYETENDPVG